MCLLTGKIVGCLLATWASPSTDRGHKDIIAPLSRNSAGAGSSHAPAVECAVAWEFIITSNAALREKKLSRNVQIK